MSQKSTTGTQDTPNMEVSVANGDGKAKREMAGRLLIGNGVKKDKAKAVSLLEDCVAHGDADAMLLLAKCCALGCGMEHNTERAETLVSDAAKKGNKEARFLMKLINDWKEEESVDLDGLIRRFFKEPKRKSHVGVVYAGCIKGECTIERVALVMNIVPCQDFDLKCKA